MRPVHFHVVTTQVDRHSTRASGTSHYQQGPIPPPWVVPIHRSIRPPFFLQASLSYARPASRMQPEIWKPLCPKLKN